MTSDTPEFTHDPGASERRLGSQVVDAPLARPVAAQFHTSWLSSPSSPDAIGFVESAESLTPRDWTDVFLVDQHHRWDRGWELPAEAYCRALRRLVDGAGDPAAQAGVEDFEWELVEHEYLRRQAASDAASRALALRELCDRFPTFAARLRDRFGSPDPEGTSAFDASDRPDPSTSTAPAPPAPGAIRPRPSAELALTSLALESAPERDPSMVSGVDAGRRTPGLGSSKPFSRLPLSLIAEIEQELEPRAFDPREPLMRQGAPGDGLFLITDGLVEIQAADAAGVPHVVAVAGAGDVVGEMALVTDEPRTADVVAVGRVTAQFLPLTRFDDLAVRYPVISRVLTQLLADRLGQVDHDVLAGKTLGNYRILRRLGRGGMAIVYQAEQLQTGERVALKMMSHRLVFDSRALALFRREAQIVESFDHPNIVRMRGRFRAFRSYFIVMEYCDGVSLEHIVQHRGALPLVDVRPIVGQLAAALAYAHAHDVVHRDVKPSNAMLTRHGRVKLTDFGLANPIDSDVKGMVAGTPRYIAPEQLRGERTGTAADLFSLGCTAWRLLTGHDPNDRTVDLAKIATWNP